MFNIQKILSAILSVIVVVTLMLSVKGSVGNPINNTLNNDYWKDNGPFEVSPERARFSLTYSVVEDKSVKFSLPVAEFATPDLGYKDGEFVSLFAPGVSYLSIPGYLIGKALNISQVGSFLTITLFAIINTILVAKIAQKLGANPLSAKIASLIFLFATPAFSYATTMYQHHVSVSLILFSLYSLLTFSGFINLAIVMFLYALGIAIDYPNAIMMAPIVFYSFTRLFSKKLIDKKIVQLSFDYLKPIAILAVIPPLLLFLWFNKLSYDSPFTLSGTVPRAVGIKDGRPLFYIDSENKDITDNELESLGEQEALSFFDTRKLITGLDVHLASTDRGILYYSPVLILGLIGMIIYGKKKSIPVFWSVVGVNIILYSMWGDPWGGWAFGSRYLIPSYAIVSIFIPFLIAKMRKNYVLISIASILISYSVAVNSLGALTSTANPPEVEAQELSARYEETFKHTYERNFDLLLENKSKSFIYNTFLKDIVFVWEYYYIITVMILIGILTSLSYVTLFQKPKRKLGERY